MLKNVSKLLTGDLLKALCDMGHGDKLVIVDANYPAFTMGKRVIQYPAVKATDLLKAIVKIFPLDHIEKSPVILMNMTEEDQKIMSSPAIWGDFSEIINDEFGSSFVIDKVSREEFYEKSRDSYLIIQTGEERLYGNILLVKGVVK